MEAFKNLCLSLLPHPSRLVTSHYDYALYLWSEAAVVLQQVFLENDASL